MNVKIRLAGVGFIVTLGLVAACGSDEDGARGSGGTSGEGNGATSSGTGGTFAGGTGTGGPSTGGTSNGGSAGSGAAGIAGAAGGAAGASACSRDADCTTPQICSGGNCVACSTVQCNDRGPYACADCVDNDGDGRTDMADADCLGPCHGNEDSYMDCSGQINVPCQDDCYFDADSNPNDDGCFWDHHCDPYAYQRR